MPNYKYPVTNKFQARTVTEPSFEPALFGDESKLYVDFDRVRDTEFASKVYFPLGIDEDRLVAAPDDYIKIICSGHQGCGKTTELKRLHKYLHHPHRYFSIFLSIEEETEYGSLQPEDIFVWILLKLAEAIKENGIPVDKSDLDDLARQFQISEAIETQQTDKESAELSVEIGAGINFLSLFNFKNGLKGIFSSDNSRSTKIREEVHKNPLAIIHKINAVLASMREAVRRVGLGGDMLFIIDGSEKLRFQVYEYLFVQNANLLQSLSLNMIMAVPIDSYYRIEAGPTLKFSHNLIIPMIRLTGPGSEADECFKQVIERRIDTSVFFEPHVLDECIRWSGGCMRQLLRIVNAVVYKALGQRAALNVARAAVRAQGNTMNQLLTSKHIETLRQGLENLRPGDAEVREMLFQLVLLEYIGDDQKSYIKLNPLLADFIPLT